MKYKKNFLLRSGVKAQIKTQYVNNDVLVNETITYVNECLNNIIYNDFTNEYDRTEITVGIEYYCSILIDNNVIEQFDIIFDKRNNKHKDMIKGQFNLEVKLKQKNCLNVTSIKYSIGYPDEED